MWEYLRLLTEVAIYYGYDATQAHGCYGTLVGSRSVSVSITSSDPAKAGRDWPFLADGSPYFQMQVAIFGSTQVLFLACGTASSAPAWVSLAAAVTTDSEKVALTLWCLAAGLHDRAASLHVSPE